MRTVFETQTIIAVMAVAARWRRRAANPRYTTEYRESCKRRARDWLWFARAALRSSR